MALIPNREDHPRKCLKVHFNRFLYCVRLKVIFCEYHESVVACVYRYELFYSMQGNLESTAEKISCAVSAKSKL